MQEERVRINLHEFDKDKVSISKGFREAAHTQGWKTETIDEILARASQTNVSNMLNILSNYSEPDYIWEEEDDYEWDGNIEEEYYINNYDY